jgi:hypothetical protein
VVSGGRASVLLALLYIGVISLINRRMLLMAGATCLASLIVVIANLFSGFINKDLPVYVARPLQYVMIEKGEAMDSIEHSSSYRQELYMASLEEWMSDPRITMLGRSVYVPLEYTELKSVVGDMESFVMVNLNSGTCHALLPSALVQYGALGAMLYYLVYFMLIRFFWRAYQLSKTEVYSQDLRMVAFLMSISTGIGMIVATIGGAWFGGFQVVMVVLVKSMAARDELAYRESREQEGGHENQSPASQGPAWGPRS